MDREILEKLICGHSGWVGKVTSLIKLPGDASTRDYFRATLNSSGEGHRFPPSVIIMNYPPEHIVDGELTFVNVHRYLQKAGVAIPDIFLHLPDSRLLILEDAGDRTLEKYVEENGFSRETEFLYRTAIEEIVRVQDSGTSSLDNSALPSKVAFDMNKLMEEMDFFFSYGPRNLVGAEGMEEKRSNFMGLMKPVIREITSLGLVLTHRDFHSRNIMVCEDRSIRIIDFQDARMGCIYYDLASLLFDSYVEVPNGIFENLTNHYMYLVRDMDLKDFSHVEDFMEKLYIMGIQRNIKALGTFFYMYFAKGNSRYLDHVMLTVRHLDRNRVLNDRYAQLRDFLFPLIEKLADQTGLGKGG